MYMKICDDGDLMFISPNLPHVWKNDKAFYQNNKNAWVDVYVIQFSEDALTEKFFNLPEFTNVKKLFLLGQQGLLIKGKDHRKISELINTDFHGAMQSPRGGDLLANETNNETPH